MQILTMILIKITLIFCYRHLTHYFVPREGIAQMWAFAIDACIIAEKFHYT